MEDVKGDLPAGQPGGSEKADGDDKDSKEAGVAEIEGVLVETALEVLGPEKTGEPAKDSPDYDFWKKAAGSSMRQAIRELLQHENINPILELVRMVKEHDRFKVTPQMRMFILVQLLPYFAPPMKAEDAGRFEKGDLIVQLVSQGEDGEIKVVGEIKKDAPAT